VVKELVEVVVVEVLEQQLSRRHVSISQVYGRPLKHHMTHQVVVVVVVVVGAILYVLHIIASASKVSKKSS
jgi:hypothetical protein